MDVSHPHSESPPPGEPNDTKGEGVQIPLAPSQGDDAHIPIAVPVATASPAPAPEPAAPAPLTYEKPTGELGLDPYVLEGSARQHVLLPLALVCLGTAMLYGGAVWRVGFGDEFHRLAMRYSLDVIFSLLASLAACVACAGLLDVFFGLLTPAVTKLAAVIVLPLGVASLLAAALGGEGGAVALGLLVSVPVMWLLFLSLFKMEGREAVICCNALTIVRMVSILIVRPF